jgi:hypothetical protein
MAVGTEILIVEDKLKEAFAYLPEMVGQDGNLYKPLFKVGDEYELYAFFAQSQGTTKYPLIWLVRPFIETHNKNEVVIDNLTFIVAVETNAQMTDSERMDLTFKPILIPLVNKIIDLFRIANTIETGYPYSIIKFPNYSDESGDNDNALLTFGMQ